MTAATQKSASSGIRQSCRRSPNRSRPGRSRLRANRDGVRLSRPECSGTAVAVVRGIRTKMPWRWILPRLTAYGLVLVAFSTFAAPFSTCAPPTACPPAARHAPRGPRASRAHQLQPGTGALSIAGMPAGERRPSRRIATLRPRVSHVTPARAFLNRLGPPASSRQSSKLADILRV